MDKIYSTILLTIRRHLNLNSTKVFVFGSRATSKNRPFSDIDVGILPTKPINSADYFSIIDELDNSNIPFRVELVDFSKADNKFKQVAMQQVIYLN